MIRRALRTVALPATITPFERTYLARLNRLAMGVLLAHLPVLVLIAWWNETGPAFAAATAALALFGPLVAITFDDQPRRVSTVLGVSAVILAGILVHVGQGPNQIEMHFHFFVIIATLAVFGNPTVILAATATVALHHVALWLLFPASVFNHEAAVWVVALHALFVVLEAIGACFIARSFFDNVIGLERIVEKRTQALAARHRDVRQLLDNVSQGFLTIDLAGKASAEHSRAVDRWFGEAANESDWFDVLEALDPAFARRSRSAWTAVGEDFLPIELTLAQMPRVLGAEDRSYEIEYRAIEGDGDRQFLVVVNDISERVRQGEADARRREDLQLMAGLLDDRGGTLAFLDEAERSLGALASESTSLEAQKRTLHTFKGNAGVAGFEELAAHAHRLEEWLAEQDRPMRPGQLAPLVATMTRLNALADQLREGSRGCVEVEPRRLDELEEAVREGEGKGQLVERVRDLRREPVSSRLARLGEHAQLLAERLGRGDLSVTTEGGAVRVDANQWAPLWANLVHAVRNAVGHGLEPVDERIAGGKDATGLLRLRASENDGCVAIEVEDDGRGIDLRCIAARARALGIPAETDDEVHAAIFALGVSTADKVDHISGRGIGMPALKAATEALGGRLELFTRAGHGTRIRIEVPRRAEAPVASRPTRRSSAAAMRALPLAVPL